MTIRHFLVILLGCKFGCCVFGDSFACNVEEWVTDEAAPGGGEDGYHVLCALNSTTFQVYKRGVASNAPLIVDVGGADLRKSLANLLKIRAKIRYKVNGKKLVWTKQPWTLFTARGGELKPGTERDILASFFKNNERPIILLLFEGGAWRWPSMSLGYVRSVMPGITLTTISRQPALFEVNFDTGTLHDESDLNIGLLSNVVDVAKPRLAGSGGYGNTRTSEQTMLDYNKDPKLTKLRVGTAKLLRTPEENMEPLQVVKYGVNQHYDAHRDYWDPREFPNIQQFTGPDGFWNQRHVTLLWYLSAPESGGATWFPRAHGGPIPWNEWMACDARGASVHPANATAVLFYSLRADGDIDEYSWHSGCPVKAGVKWAANSWVHNGPYGRRQSATRYSWPASEEL